MPGLLSIKIRDLTILIAAVDAPSDLNKAFESRVPDVEGLGNVFDMGSNVAQHVTPTYRRINGTIMKISVFFGFTVLMRGFRLLLGLLRDGPLDRTANLIFHFFFHLEVPITLVLVLLAITCYIV